MPIITTPTRARRRLLPPTRRQVRLVLGLLWLLDAALQAQPLAFSAQWWREQFAQSVMGEPASISHSIFWAVGLIAQHAFAWNMLFVAIQAAFGAALVFDRLPRAAIVASIPWALGVWWFGEGLGLLPTGFGLLGAGSPGPVLLYPLLGLLAWPKKTGTKEPGTATVAEQTAITSWLALWAGQSLLHLPWRYSGAQVLNANIIENASGPSWLLRLDHQALVATQAHGDAISVALACLEVLIGVAVLSPTTRRPALGAGIVLMLVYWVVLQDFGHLLAGGATDPASAPLIVLLALSLWPATAPLVRRDLVEGRAATARRGAFRWRALSASEALWKAASSSWTRACRYWSLTT